MISVESVSKTFKTDLGRPQVQALKNISLKVKKGEILGIIGPNGAGKSTLLKLIMGFTRPDEGSITIDGKSPTDPQSRNKTGFLTENPYYYDHLTADELLQFSAGTAGMNKHDFRQRADSLLKTMDLSHAGRSRLRTFSKGMTQRAGLCFALIHDPELIILDEPMSGLDPVGRHLVTKLLLDLKKKGKTILFCSHILNDVEKMCDSIIIMANAEIKKRLTRESLHREGRELEKIFLKAIEAEI